jgi:hypothetical protein
MLNIALEENGNLRRFYSILNIKAAIWQPGLLKIQVTTKIIKESKSKFDLLEG